VRELLHSNQNKSFHHLLWSIPPKDQFHSPEEVKFGLDMAVVIFNNGLSIFGSMCADKQGLTAPASSVKLWKQLDNKRVYESTRSLPYNGTHRVGHHKGTDG
jgi:hypothetical protein